MLAAVMSADAALRSPHLEALLARVDENDAEARRVADDLTAEQIAWRPPEGGWGVGDCLEHLVVSGERYLETVGPLLERARAAGGEPHYGGWGGTLGGRLLIWGINSPRKLPAPKVLRPPPAPRPEALDEFLRIQGEVADRMRAADGVALGRIKVSSPVNRLVRLNLGEMFVVLQDHARRHLAQARRVREHPRFPTS